MRHSRSRRKDGRCKAGNQYSITCAHKPVRASLRVLLNAFASELFEHRGRCLKAGIATASAMTLILSWCAYPAAAADVARPATPEQPATDWSRLMLAGPPIRPPPFIDWTGIYASANFGLASGSLHGQFGGLTLGRNVQFGPTVLGIEADIDGSSLNGSASCTTAGSCDFGVRWMATVQGRFGIAVGRYLPFASIGAAIANIEIPGIGTENVTRAGLSFGGGVEVDLGRGWSARGEYRRIDFGQMSCGVVCGPTQTDFRPYSDAVRFSVGYRFAPEATLQAKNYPASATAKGPGPRPPPF